MSQNAESHRSCEITIDSNWILTIGMAVLFVVCVALLIREIRNLILGSVPTNESLTVFSTVFTIIAALYFLLFAFWFRVKSLKIAFVLLGLNQTARVMLSYFHLSSDAQHFTAVAHSVSFQVALTISLVAMAQWFKSVVHWVPPSDRGTADS